MKDRKFRNIASIGSQYRTGIELVATGDAWPGREVVVEEAGDSEEVKGAHRDGGVLIRQSRSRCPRPPRMRRVHPVDGDAEGFVGEEQATKQKQPAAVRQGV
jgi:hypothetical protein